MIGSRSLIAERIRILGTEEAFALGALIAEVEAESGRVIRCNLGQPDFPLPTHIADAVIDATSVDDSPALAVRLVKPAGRVVFIGISSTPSRVDSRDIALKDVTAVGILSASPGLAGAIEGFASGAVVPDALVSEVISLDDVPSRLDGERGPDAGPGPKVHVDPRR